MRMDDNQWKVYILTFRLISPIHIGLGKVGNLQQTRGYVPARTIVGALTARLARDVGVCSDKDVYEKTLGTISKNLRFSYFYFVDRVFDETDTANYCCLDFPWRLHDCNNDDRYLFQWKYLNSYMGSPITDIRVTEKGSLHETEYIMPYTREGKQVYMTGFVFEKRKPDNNIIGWKESIANIRIGGERSYGWGKVAPVRKGWMAGASKMFGMELELNKDNPQVFLSAKSHITSHVAVNKTKQDKIYDSKIEIFVGRATKEAEKHGKCFTVALPCWAPGTKIMEKKHFSVCTDGTWVEVV